MQGLLLDSLTQWPAVYQFQLVVKQQPAAAAGEAAPASGEQQQQQQGSSPEQALLKRYRSLIADTTAADISPQDCTAKPRMGGRYVSLCIPARVQVRLPPCPPLPRPWPGGPSLPACMTLTQRMRCLTKCHLFPP